MGILTPIQKATQEALKKPITPIVPTVPVVPATPVAPVSPTSNFDAIQVGIDQAKKTLAGIQSQVPSAISSAFLAPAADLSKQITTSTPTLPPVVPPVETPTTPTTPLLVKTPQEQQAQDWVTRLQSLNDQLVGKSAYQTEQETAQGIPELQKTQNDLTVQLNALANEAKAIPIQFQGLAQTAGVNQPSLQRQESYQLRDNAIKALTLNSLLASSQGNLAYAQSLADKAVAANYDPITEEIKAKTANVNLILNSPDATIADKNRAQAQLDIQNQKKEDTATDKSALADILKLANDAITNGLTDTLILNQIQNAKDANGRPSLALAQQILAKSGFVKEKLNTATREVNGRVVLYNTQTGETIKDLGTAITTATDTERLSKIDRFMTGRVGTTDNLISAETYYEAKKMWNEAKGADSDFKIYYPPEKLMRKEELNRLYKLYPTIFTAPKSSGEITNEDIAE